jgi:hypothetical protein
MGSGRRTATEGDEHDGKEDRYARGGEELSGNREDLCVPREHGTGCAGTRARSAHLVPTSFRSVRLPGCAVDNLGPKMS